MAGSVPPSIQQLTPMQQAQSYSFRKLHSYDQQRMEELGSINTILYKPKSFLKERKCQKQSQWLQQFFATKEQQTEMVELIEYYKYYRNSPLMADLKYIDVMLGYWTRKKTLYYKKIKKELQLDDEPDSSLTPQVMAESTNKSKIEQTLFQLPSQLRSYRTTFLDDPDATLRHLLTAMSTKNIKEETRQASQVGEFQQKSSKSHLKGQHMRTNPSNLGSCSSVKKQKRKNTHKSHSNQSNRSPARQKKINNFVGIKKISTKASQSTLNYQRRNNKQPKQKKLKQVREQKIHNRQVSTGKHKSSEKSQGKILVKKVSSGKLREVESTKVKAAITKVRDKIKAEKNVAMKKYLLERKSCSRSIEAKQIEMRRSRK